MNINYYKKIIPRKKKGKSLLYLISPENLEIKKFQLQLEAILMTGTVSIFQLRLKDICEKTLTEHIKKLFPICKKYNVLFILSDNPKLVKLLDLDGVHVGEQDPSISKCREIIGKYKIIGKSCYNSPRLATRSQNNGADYIAFGAFFKTKTKKTFKKINFDQLKKWKNLKKIPVIGIGGINIANCRKISRFHLDFFAISSAVWKSDIGAVKYLKKFKNLIDKN